MPELPEVETIKNDLRSTVQGRTIVTVRVLDPGLVRYPSLGAFQAGLEGQTIRSVDRRAKYLLLHLSSGRILVIQLILTGQLLLVRPERPLAKSTRMVLELDGDEQLRLVDSIHFARVNLVDAEELDRLLPLQELGPEANSPELSLERFAELISSRNRKIKPLLLDQRVVSGLGNIYTDESLFAAHIHPLRRASTLTPSEIAKLYHAMRAILLEAVALRGTTTRSYRDVGGEKGGFQQRLKVVARAGKPCFGCPGVVEKTIVGGRETYLCPSCQRLEGPASQRAA
jgi:formamidopyrimidine-DNA glycosylase